MASNDAKMDDSDTGSALTDALGTEILKAKSMVPTEFQQPPKRGNAELGMGEWQTILQG
jgi:hypothetical protein